MLLKISRMKEIIKPTKPHKHDGYFEIIYLSDGAGLHIIDDKEFNVEPPMMFFLNPGHVHCWEFSKIPKGFVVLFKEELLGNYPESKLLLSQLSKTYYLKKETGLFDSDLEQLKMEFDAGKPMLSILSAYLNIVLLKISRLPRSSDYKKAVNPLILQFRRLVDSHFMEHKPLSFYANNLRVSQRVLTNNCKKELGRSASSVLNERIITECKRLLKHTNNSISEIAFHLNFTDPSHFVKFFKAKTRLTPGEFRARL